MREFPTEEKWLLANSSQNEVQIDRSSDEEGEEETLSLCDLPVIHHQSRKAIENAPKIEDDEEFDFSNAFSKASQMCAADDVFYRGQLLPLRHSVNSEKGQLLMQDAAGYNFTRSESIDRSSSYSSGLISSRSSSISSGSGSTSTTTTTIVNRRKSHPKPRNVFHSHPSPSPKVPRLNNKNPTNVTRKPSTWSIFRLGLLVAPPPEITFQGISNISNNGRNFGSRKSTSSNISIGSIRNAGKKKKGISVLLKNAGGGGCKCSVDAVDDTVRSKVVVIKRSATENDDVAEEEKNVVVTKKQEAKKQMSHHRTFEWLKQLSLVEDDNSEFEKTSVAHA